MTNPLQLGKFSVITVAALFVVSVAIEVAYGNDKLTKAARTYSRPDETLLTTDGTKVTGVFDPSSRRVSAFVTVKGRRAALADGTYRLTNGGAIRVMDGVIVWDAFGVIDKLGQGLQPGNNAG